LAADGSEMVTTTKLTLTFDKDIDGFSAADITLDAGYTGAVKGTLTTTSTEGVYELAVRGLSEGGSVTVTVSKSLYTITGGPQTVTVYYYTLGMEMANVPGGSFQMGNPDTAIPNSDNERPEHAVTLAGFYMGKHEVTQKQWLTVIGSTIEEQQTLAGSTDDNGKGDNFPIYFVNWFEAIVFCNKLSVMEGFSPAYRIDGSTNPAAWGEVPASVTHNNYTKWNAVTIVPNSTGYRLPTEAQWEYAARGGNGSPGGYTYSGGNTIGDVAWYVGNTSYTPGTAGWGSRAVGTKDSNGLGLHDMSGNVEEWCWDRYGGYSGDDQDNPAGADAGTNRVHRGGYFSADAQSCRSACRSSDNPSTRTGGGIVLGFRVARPLQ
jgi:formylglycine-generating enzyme required for sulfatase activity